jgi:hypothetical protein
MSWPYKKEVYQCPPFGGSIIRDMELITCLSIWCSGSAYLKNMFFPFDYYSLHHWSARFLLKFLQIYLIKILKFPQYSMSLIHMLQQILGNWNNCGFLRAGIIICTMASSCIAIESLAIGLSLTLFWHLHIEIFIDGVKKNLNMKIWHVTSEYIKIYFKQSQKTNVKYKVCGLNFILKNYSWINCCYLLKQ